MATNVIPSRWHWYLLAIVLLTVCFVRIRLVSMPLERDEGEYACMGRLMLQGTPPYQEAYGMKFPGIYVCYAAILKTFGETDRGIRLALLCVSLLTSGGIFLLGCRLFTPLAGLWSALAYSVLSLSPSLLGITANAEHFVNLAAVVGLCCVVRTQDSKRWIAAGIFLGIALCIKQQGGAFLLAIPPLLFVTGGPSTIRKRSICMAVFLAGVAAPILLMLCWLKSTGVLRSFRFWTLDYASHYGSMWSFRDGVDHFFTAILPLARIHFLIPLTAAAATILLWKKERMTLLTAIALLGAGLLATAPGLIFRSHYFIMVLPGLALLAGGGFASSSRAGWLALVWLGIAFGFQGTFLFLDSPEQASRRLYPTNAFVEAREAGLWLRANAPAESRIGILGSEPEILFYAQRRPATPFLYVYPLMEPQPYALSMQKDFIQKMENSPPPYLVHVRVPTSWLAYPASVTDILEWSTPFVLKHYDEAKVYHPFGPADSRTLSIYRLKAVSSL